MQTTQTATLLRRAFAQSRVALARAVDTRADYCDCIANADSATLREALSQASRADRAVKVARRSMRGSATANAVGFVACLGFALVLAAGAASRALEGAHAARVAAVARMACAESADAPIVAMRTRADVENYLGACHAAR